MRLRSFVFQDTLICE